LTGLEYLHYAKMSADTTSAATYATPKLIAGAINAKITPKVNSEVQWADNRVYAKASNLETVDVELEISEIPLDILCELLGHTMVNGVMISKSTDQAPEVAIGFVSQKKNKKKRFVWLYKGTFEIPTDENHTEEGKPKIASDKIRGTFVARNFDKAWRAIADEDAVNYTATIGNNWFTKVYENPAA
jgi:phi13 family phage major tail protein